MRSNYDTATRGDSAWYQLAEDARRIASLLEGKARAETSSRTAPVGSERLRRLTQLESAILRSLADGKQIATTHTSIRLPSETTAAPRGAFPLMPEPAADEKPELETNSAPARRETAVGAGLARLLSQHQGVTDFVRRKGGRVALIAVLAAGIEAAAVDAFQTQSGPLFPAAEVIAGAVEPLAAAVQASPALAQPAQSAANAVQDLTQRMSVKESYGAWSLQCFGAPILRCELTSVLPGANAITANIVRARADKQDTLNVIGPFGVLLKERARISIDGSYGTGMNIVTCLQSGCVFQLKVDQELLDNLSQGAEMRASFVMSNKQNSNLSIPLSGLADAYIRMATLLRS